jgi:hypothetical protein
MERYGLAFEMSFSGWSKARDMKAIQSLRFAPLRPAAARKGLETAVFGTTEVVPLRFLRLQVNTGLRQRGSVCDAGLWCPFAALGRV